VLLKDFSSYSVFIAGIIALIRFNFINKIYYPFIFIIWIACLTEITGKLLKYYGYPNILSSNIYSLLEVLLYLQLFKNLGIMNKPQYLLWGLSFSLLIFWFAENIFKYGSFLTNNDSYFFITADFLLVLFSINMFNVTVSKEKDISKSAVFWICIGMMIYFTYTVVIEIFWLYGIRGNLDYFSESVYKIHSWVNILCNLIFAVAILWVRKKEAFTLRF
jgi:hypothetical protein